MSSSLANALIEAINDEYKSRATYQQVINVFGSVRPFINIVKSENRHVEALLYLFNKYDIAVPPDDWPSKVKTPDSIEEACLAGVNDEIENAEMYTRLLSETKEYPDVQDVLRNLQRASQENHLPAFKRCVDSAAEMGREGDTQCRKRRRGRS